MGSLSFGTRGPARDPDRGSVELTRFKNDKLVPCDRLLFEASDPENEGVFMGVELACVDYVSSKHHHP